MTAAAAAVGELRSFAVRILGEPQPQGSKTPMPVRRAGQIVSYNLLDGRRPEARQQFKTWRGELVAAVREAMRGETWRLGGPIALRVTCTLARPGGHFGTGRNAGELRPSAPAFPCVKPDGGKLQRATEDALTVAGAWEDDARVVAWQGFKLYPAQARLLEDWEPLQIRLPVLGAVEVDPLPVPGVVVRVAQIGA